MRCLGNDIRISHEDFFMVTGIMSILKNIFHIHKPTNYNILYHISTALKEAIFPNRCLVCGAFFQFKSQALTTDAILLERDPFYDKPVCIDQHTVFYRVMAPFLCATCLKGYSPVESPLCPKCGILFISREGDDHFCQACIMSPPKYGIARATGIYDQSLMTLIHRFKYNGKLQLARPLGFVLFFSFLKFFGQSGIDLIIPIPLHNKRFRQRGFNQSFLLLEEWNHLARSIKGISLNVEIEKECLIRSKHTMSQTGLNREKRISNLKNAFIASGVSEISGKNILLVDDVYTTGTTANECARVLLRNGANRVDVLTLARAI